MPHQRTRTTARTHRRPKTLEGRTRIAAADLTYIDGILLAFAGWEARRVAAGRADLLKGAAKALGRSPHEIAITAPGTWHQRVRDSDLTRDEPIIRLFTAYDPQVTEDLRREVPSARWSADHQAWTVPVADAAALDAFLNARFPAVADAGAGVVRTNQATRAPSAAYPLLEAQAEFCLRDLLVAYIGQRPYDQPRAVSIMLDDPTGGPPRFGRGVPAGAEQALELLATRHERVLARISAGDAGPRYLAYSLATRRAEPIAHSSTDDERTIIARFRDAIRRHGVPVIEAASMAAAAPHPDTEEARHRRSALASCVRRIAALAVSNTTFVGLEGDAAGLPPMHGKIDGAAAYVLVGEEDHGVERLTELAALKAPDVVGPVRPIVLARPYLDWLLAQEEPEIDLADTVMHEAAHWITAMHMADRASTDRPHGAAWWVVLNVLRRAAGMDAPEPADECPDDELPDAEGESVFAAAAAIANIAVRKGPLTTLSVARTARRILDLALPGAIAE